MQKPLKIIAISLLVCGCESKRQAPNGPIMFNQASNYFVTNNVYDIRSLTFDYFETGVRLGYILAAHGGTPADVEKLIRSKRENNPDLIPDCLKTKINR
jgi:hypothetical protein